MSVCCLSVYCAVGAVGCVASSSSSLRAPSLDSSSVQHACCVPLPSCLSSALLPDNAPPLPAATTHDALPRAALVRTPSVLASVALTGRWRPPPLYNVATTIATGRSGLAAPSGPCDARPRAGVVLAASQVPLASCTRRCCCAPHIIPPTPSLCLYAQRIARPPVSLAACLLVTYCIIPAATHRHPPSYLPRCCQRRHRCLAVRGAAQHLRPIPPPTPPYSSKPHPPSTQRVSYTITSTKARRDLCPAANNLASAELASCWRAAGGTTACCRGATQHKSHWQQRDNAGHESHSDHPTRKRCRLLL